MAASQASRRHARILDLSHDICACMGACMQVGKDKVVEGLNASADSFYSSQVGPAGQRQALGS